MPATKRPLDEATKALMGNRISTRFADNLAAMADETKYKIGDILTILSGLSLVLLAVKKQYKTIAVALVFVLYIYLLILNCAYWVLPASELLYPERIAYFMIVPLACLFALMIDIYKGYSLSFNKGKVKIKIALFLATGLGIFGLIRIYNGSQELIHEKTVLIDANTLNSIEWINTHTPSNAIFTASYNDAGMWLPTLCNRPTIGTHLHFIHEIMHINDTLQASNAPHYYFVTTKDTTEHTHITTLISSKTLVYTNSGVWIYR
ncbi:MAG: hypothetical protein EBX41_07305 [Chitinophagia bacterium]|nr:hypothetical protein [Chitinophagia bacterium]